MNTPIDPRIAANYIITSSSRPIRQIALQKILYFAHGRYLTQTGTPLVKGYFEAWHYGPVHPAIYAEFKRFGRDAIAGLAESIDLRTGELAPLPTMKDQIAIEIVGQTIDAYSRFSDSQLVELSHAKDGPWDVIKQRSKNQRLIGVRIPNELIEDRFNRHKLSVRRLLDAGEVYDDQDTPIAYYGFS
jgi:uncharacterized phage-associated protein